MPLDLKPASRDDLHEAMPFIQEIIQAGETYALPRDMDEQAVHDYFFRKGNHVFKATLDDHIVGVCYLRPNQEGGGKHVANAGFMVSSSCRGKGVARFMAERLFDRAAELQFLAMQFNFVVSTNSVAVALWKNLGFTIVGTLPMAFSHPRQGKVDAYVMYRIL